MSGRRPKFWRRARKIEKQLRRKWSKETGRPKSEFPCRVIPYKLWLGQ